MIRRVAGIAIVAATPSRPRVAGVGAAGACGSAAGATLSASSAPPLVAESRRYFLNKDKNPYYILNIKPGASKAEIKKAYRVMAAKHHPDAPGGSNEKFQEIQAAYEEIKTGVWVPKGGNSDGSGSSDGVSQTNNKYGGFQWYTDGKRGNKMSYEKMQERMQKGSSDTKGEFDDDDEEEPAKSKYRNPMGASDQQVQAWFRLITLWAALFVVCRIALFLLFPPKHTHAPKKPLPEKPRKPPPPKPIQHSPMLA